jgi:hypothetical protein
MDRTAGQKRQCSHDGCDNHCLPRRAAGRRWPDHIPEWVAEWRANRSKS